MRESRSFDREVFTHEGFGVQLRPLPGGDGDLGELLAGGAILVHVAGGCQSVHTDRVSRFVRGLVGEGLGARDEASTGGALGRAIGFKGDLAQTASIAAAWKRCETKELPPMLVASLKRGRMPRYSPTERVGI